jgi:hypothetical protein
MKSTSKLFAFALWVLAASAWAQSPPPMPARMPPPQPIPFSHKTHAAAGLTCQGCHTIAPPGDLAGYPAAAFCMGCHATLKKDSPAIQALAAFAKDRTPIPWIRVYRVPDFVYFSHEVHHKQAGVECAACHGPVAEREVVVREKSTAMADCMKCHDQRRAANGCDVCHDSH